MPYGADPFPIFTPALATIAGITRGQTTTIFTDLPITFLEGESVRMLIPREYGMTQMNNLVGNIIFTSNVFDSLFVVDIDSTSFDAFVVPMVQSQMAQVIPVGEDALMLTGATKNVLPYP